jgi:hypothetical protein
MYGLVNQAIEEIVTEFGGEAVWQAVLREAQVDVPAFISNEQYDDTISYRLVGAAAQLLALPADELLIRLGRHWVLRTARENYGPLLAHAGKTLPEFMRNLPSFHQRVKLIFPSLQPPRFEVSEQGPQRLLVIYQSHREGLAPFVVGLMEGLGTMYGTPVTVTHTVRRGEVGDHDEFIIAW